MEKIEKMEKHWQAKVIPALQKELGVTNALALPRLTKLVVTTGVGRIKDDKRLKFIAERLAKITGQKAAPRGAKRAIASFKSRQGDVVGYQVTLRGARMWGFLDKFLNVVIPRVRDFRGLDQKSVDEGGNLTIAVREHTVFPETADEELKDVFGLAVTLTVKTRSSASRAEARRECLAFWKALGIPFRS
jgi:large subunit ribosomal protein L5